MIGLLTPRAMRAGSGVGMLMLGLAFSGITAVLITVMGAAILPRLLGPMQEQGMALPWLTQAFASIYLLVWLAPLAVLAGWLLGQGVRHWLAAVIGIASMLLAGSIAVVAMYMAVFAQAGAL